ncbi:hypothetical protein RIF29_01909 [Crotalaria pallida]|uniref:Uncharacterized protein n=1 Tax=Crotalaria pallida TaxID=3830 RepID=A0AAN9IXT9_CROPI
MDELGFCDSVSRVIGTGRRTSIEDHFMCNYPHVMLSQLASVTESGIYICLATIVGSVENSDMLYNECSCKGSLFVKSSALYCENCARYIFNFVPRFV